MNRPDHVTAIPLPTPYAIATEGTQCMGPERVLSPEALEERELVLAAQAGDSTAFAGLVRRHQRRAYAVARAIADHVGGAVYGRRWPGSVTLERRDTMRWYLNRVHSLAAPALLGINV